MRHPFGRLMPTRIAAQSAAVVALSVVVMHVAITVHIRLLESGDAVRRRDFAHVGTAMRAVMATPVGEERQRVADALARAFPALEIDLSRTPPSEGPQLRSGAPPDRLPPPFADLGEGVHIVETSGAAARDGPPMVPAVFSGPPEPRRFAVALDGGDWLRVTDRPPPPPFPLGPWGVSILFVVLSSTLLGVWALRGLVGPLRALAAAARDFDIEGEPAPLPQRGPDEVRVAASAFEAMRRRIRALVEDRTRMLAAMGHDLRTPLTRLRLRSEFVPDATLRSEIQRDLAAMNAMIDGALTYLAEGRHREGHGLVDLSVAIRTICDGWSDLGRDVAFEGPEHLVWRVRPLAIERAISNLVDNALKFGSRCVVRLGAAGEGVRIEVEDDGPGIAEGDKEAMLRPFVRGDAARNMNEARGFGLGLAIVAAVVDGHGGRLELEAAVPHGLRVRITLPAAARGAAPDLTASGRK